MSVRTTTLQNKYNKTRDPSIVVLVNKNNYVNSRLLFFENGHVWSNHYFSFDISLYLNDVSIKKLNESNIYLFETYDKRNIKYVNSKYKDENEYKILLVNLYHYSFRKILDFNHHQQNYTVKTDKQIIRSDELKDYNVAIFMHNYMFFHVVDRSIGTKKIKLLFNLW